MMNLGETKKTKVMYSGKTSIINMDLEIICENGFDHLMAIENRRWLYPKLIGMMSSIECALRADANLVDQVNKIMDKAHVDLIEAVKISKEESEYKNRMRGV
jgi:hypothetical protein